MSESDATKTKYQVVCVCGGYGFPISASAARIIMVGRALQESGIEMQVLHCGPSPIPVNIQKSGTYQGIPFEYTTSIRRPENRFLRLLVYARGLLGLTFRLIRVWPNRRSTLVYLYVMDGVLNLCTGALCQLLGIPVFQELCEWVPGQSTSSVKFNGWLYRTRIFKVATGALVISRAIEERTRQWCVDRNPDLLIYRAPVMVDAQRFAAASPGPHLAENRVPNFVYCGTYLGDILFLVLAFSLVRRDGHECTLTIIGQCGSRNRPAIMDHAMKHGLTPADVILTGSVDERTLEQSYKTATGLLMPLFKDDKSITRFPNKMGEYLAAGRPVITSAIGDLTNFLTDNVNAYVGEPGNERAFADKVIEVLEDPGRADRIGAAGQETCFTRLDFRAQSQGLSDFVLRCIEFRNRRRSTRNDSVPLRTAAMVPVQLEATVEECNAEGNLN